MKLTANNFMSVYNIIMSVVMKSRALPNDETLQCIVAGGSIL